MSKELPIGWVEKPLGHVVLLNEKSKDIVDEAECGFVPMKFMPTNLRENLEYELRVWGDCKKGYTHFQDGDVLLAKITPCFENGKSALVRGLPNGIGAGSTEYFVLRSEKIDSRYIHCFVKTKQFMDDCTVRMSGSVGHKRVPKDYLLEYPIPIAPPNEQIRIANKLDSLLAKVDAVQARLDTIPTLLKRFRQSVLAAATSGELTKEWRPQGALKDVSSTWQLDPIPETWSVVLLPEVAESRLGKMLDKSKNVGLPTKYLGNINVRWQEFDLADLKEILVSEKERTELSIQNDDLLVCEGGEPGRAAVWGGGENNLVFQKAIHRVRFNDTVDPKFALYCLRDDYDTNRLDSL